MGSDSDWPQLKHAVDALKEFGVSCFVRVTSAHRTPDRMDKTMQFAAKHGFKVIIAAAGGSAHLQGMSAGKTRLPVLAVGIKSSSSDQSTDASIGSCIFMPKGVPLAFMGIGEAGAYNAGLEAVRILALSDPPLAERYGDFVERMAAAVPEVPKDIDPHDVYPTDWHGQTPIG